MPVSGTQLRWNARVVEQLDAMDGVTTDVKDGRKHVIKMENEGRTAEAVLAATQADYRELKDQYARLREALSGLGIEEGAHYVPPPPPASGRPATPQMRAARQKQKQKFEAWQDVWRMLRKAEEALEVDYEIIQMKDYY